MSQEFATAADDQSHYEISLTAGQAFLAFVLLLLSLAASFTFGLMIGRGQADDRLVVRKEPAVIQEGSVLAKQPPGRIVDFGVSNDDFKPSHAKNTAKPVDEIPTSSMPVIAEEAAAPASVVTSAAAVPDAAIASAAPVTQPVAAAPVVAPQAATLPAASAKTDAKASAPVIASKPAATPQKPVTATVPARSPVYAQLLSTADQKTAETLAAKLIDHGFTGAYVERNPGEKGMMFRVRIRYPSEAEARAAEPALRALTKEVWIAK